MLEGRTRRCGKVKDSVANLAWRNTRIKSAWSYTLTCCEILGQLFASGFFPYLEILTSQSCYALLSAHLENADY